MIDLNYSDKNKKSRLIVETRVNYELISDIDLLVDERKIQEQQELYTAWSSYQPQN